MISLPEPVKNSRLAGDLEELLSVYAALDQAHQDYNPVKQGLACPPGCGRCCVGFHPWVTPVEARLIALGLGEDFDPEGLDSEAATCPFYRPDTPYHCSIYETRPLVCRSFGFTSALNKRGEAQFRPCRWMPLEALPGTPPPVLAPFASRIRVLNPSEPDKKLAQALPAEVQRLRWLLQASRDGDPPA